MAQPPPGKRTKFSEESNVARRDPEAEVQSVSDSSLDKTDSRSYSDVLPQSLTDSSDSVQANRDDKLINDCWHVVNEARRTHSQVGDFSQDLTQTQLDDVHRTVYLSWVNSYVSRMYPGRVSEERSAGSDSASSESKERDCDDQQQSTPPEQNFDNIETIYKKLEELKASNEDQPEIEPLLSQEATCPVTHLPLERLIDTFIALLQLIVLSAEKLKEIERPSPGAVASTLAVMASTLAAVASTSAAVASTSAVVASTSAKPVETRSYTADSLRKFRRDLFLDAARLLKKFRPDETDPDTLSGQTPKTQRSSDSDTLSQPEHFNRLRESRTLDDSSRLTNVRDQNISTDSASRSEAIALEEPIVQAEHGAASSNRPDQLIRKRLASSDTMHSIDSLKTDSPDSEAVDPLLSPESEISEEETKL